MHTDNLLVPDVDAARLFAGSFREADAPKLSPESFAHVCKPYRLMESYLKAARQHSAGVNILLYGKPDTVKTELVRTLVKDCGAMLYEISMEDARAIAMLTNLVPGDFAAVKKRLNILGLDATPDVMIQELKTEVEVKRGSASNPIGFIGS